MIFCSNRIILIDNLKRKRYHAKRAVIYILEENKFETTEENGYPKPGKNPWERYITDKDRRKRKRRILTTAVTLTLAVSAAAGALLCFGIRTNGEKRLLAEGKSAFEQGDYALAARIFDGLTEEGVADETEKTAAWYRALCAIDTGDYFTAVRKLRDLDNWGSSSFYLRQLNSLLSGVCDAGDRHSVALKKDGTVYAAGNNEYGQCNVAGWRDIVALAAGINHTLGLRGNGTVIACGDNSFGQCDVGDWKNVVAAGAGKGHSIAALNNGRAAAVGDNSFGQCDVGGWSGIIAVAAGYNHTVGLREDGTVTAAGDNSLGQCDVEQWCDIVSITACGDFTAAVRSDGTVLTTGDNSAYQCDTGVLGSADFVSAGDFHLLAVSGGRLKVIGDNDWHQADTALWKRLISAAGGRYHSVGVCDDGTAYSAGDNKSGQCDVDSWSNLGLPERSFRLTSIKKGER